MARGRLSPRNHLPDSVKPMTRVRSPVQGLTAAEKTFVRVFLDTANETYAYEQAFSKDVDSKREAYALLREPRVEACIFREITAKMYRGAVLGTKVLIDLSTNVDTPANVKCMCAVELRRPIMSQISHNHRDSLSLNDRSLSEQSIDELRALVDSLETQRADAATTVNGATSRATSQQDIDLLKELEPE